MVEEVLLRYCLHNDYAEKEGEKLTITHIKKAQQLKGMHCFKLGMWKGYQLSVEAVYEGSTFTVKKGKRLDLGAEPPRQWLKGHMKSFIHSPS